MKETVMFILECIGVLTVGSMVLIGIIELRCWIGRRKK